MTLRRSIDCRDRIGEQILCDEAFRTRVNNYEQQLLARMTLLKLSISLLLIPIVCLTLNVPLLQTLRIASEVLSSTSDHKTFNATVKEGSVYSIEALAVFGIGAAFGTFSEG